MNSLPTKRRKAVQARAAEIIAEEKARQGGIGREVPSGNTWNYRVLRHPDGSLSLHEVYYEAGRPVRYTADPVYFAVDEDEGLAGLRADLERALSDVKKRPILDIAKFQQVAAGRDRSR
jgi:hypothetical protein